MRCLFLITDLQIGGTPRVVYELATRLRNDNVETAVACLAPWGPVADELCRAGVAVTALGATQPWQLPAVVRSVTELASESDVVFSFLMHANVAAALAARRTSGVRWIQSIQTTQPKPRWHWPLQGWAAKAAQHIVVPSKSVAEWAAKRSKIPADQFVVIPNAVDVDAYASLPRPPLNVIHRVGFIGRLDPVKRLPDLLRAVAALSSTHLSIFGDGPERLRLVRMIEQLKLQSRVTLHGTIPSAKAALPLIDTLVLPSDAE
ncbi:MAG TPA: glycosyltransferase, partial [Tepidisphaeraceae bacterium]